MQHFYLALSFLTRLPLQQSFDSTAIGKSMAWFPAVGLFLGSVLVLFFNYCQSLLPEAVAVLLALLLLIWLTRALHLDGFCDTIDGLYLSVNREKALSAMKDSQVGSMAAVALWGLLSVKLLALLSLGSLGKLQGLALMPVVSRWMIVVAAYTSSYARQEGGLGKQFVEQVGFFELTGASLTALFCLVLTFGVNGLEVALFLITLTLGSSLFFKQRFGGVTGDTLGALAEVIEVFFLLLLLMEKI